MIYPLSSLRVGTNSSKMSAFGNAIAHLYLQASRRVLTPEIYLLLLLNDLALRPVGLCPFTLDGNSRGHGEAEDTLVRLAGVLGRRVIIKSCSYQRFIVILFRSCSYQRFITILIVQMNEEGGNWQAELA